MNKFFKYTFIALLGVLTLGLSSCTDEYEYTPTSKTELGGNAYLVSEGSTAISFLPSAEQSFTFQVSRVDSTEAQTVSLSSSNEKFTVPATVSFAAGQKTAEVKVSFNIATGTYETNLHQYVKFLIGFFLIHIIEKIHNVRIGHTPIGIGEAHLTFFYFGETCIVFH